MNKETKKYIEHTITDEDLCCLDRVDIAVILVDKGFRGDIPIEETVDFVNCCTTYTQRLEE